uniref:AAA family ATPase n=1 Tax=Sphingomonas sp. Leaf24 TaxID=1735690 RepID=UPI003FA68373
MAAPDDAAIPRAPGLTLRRLRLGGFKSFVDPADLVIEAGLTGVVGPNGCGKSNLLEALRWTMGENSAKSLRGAGMDDVIFAGTATRPQRDFAEVAILAEDANGDEVEIVRRIERGAGSAYRINGRDVRAKDVSLLFADAATGAHSPALVSQNRIGAVIAARPAERRAMLEEAAGIAGLHVRRRDAEGKLRATEANLDRLGEMAHEQDARATTLRRQARVAARYRELTDAIRVAEARALYARWRDAVAAADAATAEAKAAEALVAGQAGAQGQAAGELSAATQTLATARADAERLRQQVGDVGHARERVQAQANAATRRLADLTAQAARLTEDRAREAALAGDAETAVARLEAERTRLADTLAGATPPARTRYRARCSDPRRRNGRQRACRSTCGTGRRTGRSARRHRRARCRPRPARPRPARRSAAACRTGGAVGGRPVVRGTHGGGRTSGGGADRRRHCPRGDHPCRSRRPVRAGSTGSRPVGPCRRCRRTRRDRQRDCGTRPCAPPGRARPDHRFGRGRTGLRSGIGGGAGRRSRRRQRSGRRSPLAGRRWPNRWAGDTDRGRPAVGACHRPAPRPATGANPGRRT